ncbi:MAG: type II toxin-antitoxin system RelE/ParE family toxin [Caldilineaceae bacterium]|nr:type II toxin-antitoxin system RelE/ParE family toxin [Caldilineaceae bacterium]
MGRSIVFRAAAEADLREAYQWYEAQREGLGESFLLSIEAASAAIQRSPEAYPVVHKHVRRALIRRFPFGIFYLVEPEQVVVIAVLHVRRDPKHWQRRT